MMGHCYTVANCEFCYLITNLINDTRHFMTQHQRHLIPTVPFHDITAADPAGLYA